MKNPFESGHIKNYLLMYASVVVIMILFFIAATLFRNESSAGTKSFEVKSQSSAVDVQQKEVKKEEAKTAPKMKLLKKVY